MSSCAKYSGLALFLALGFTGGNAVASEAVIGSCNNPAGGMCIEYTGAGYKDAQPLQRVCEAQKATFLAGAACPTVERVGTCVRHKDKPEESRYRYYTSFPGSGMKIAV